MGITTVTANVVVFSCGSSIFLLQRIQCCAVTVVLLRYHGSITVVRCARRDSFTVFFFHSTFSVVDEPYEMSSCRPNRFTMRFVCVSVDDDF